MPDPTPPAPRLTPPIPDSIATLGNSPVTSTEGQPSSAVLEVRGLVGRITTTPAGTLATCCTPDALRAARERINEALREQEDRRRAEVAEGHAGCTHPKEKWKRLSFGVFCDETKGGCGVKVR